jgi:hypothetical protein
VVGFRVISVYIMSSPSAGGTGLKLTDCLDCQGQRAEGVVEAVHRLLLTAQPLPNVLDVGKRRAYGDNSHSIVTGGSQS